MTQNIRFGVAKHSRESFVPNNHMPSQQDNVYLPNIISGQKSGRFESGKRFFGDETLNENLPGSKKFVAQETSKIVE